jgi:adenosylmethionine-8-amino-7-oxononanoate aminotransferase
MDTHTTAVPSPGQTMSGEEIVSLCRRHTLYEWSAQSTVDPLPVAGAKGCWFWTPEGKRYLDFNSQLMCVNIGHGNDRVIAAIQRQAETLAYVNPFMATDVRARWLGHRLRAELNIAVAPHLEVTQGHAIAKEVRHELMHHVRYLSDAMIHVDPSEEAGEKFHRIVEHSHYNLPVHSH